MKKSAFVYLFLTLGLSAQDQFKRVDRHDHGLSNHETVVTTDPFGNIVETYDDPVNPLWVPGEEEAYVNPVTLEQYMKDSEARAAQLSKAGNLIVRVYLAVDTEYINRHPDWITRVITIFTSASGAFLRDAQIFFMLAGFFPWDSQGDNNSQILADLASDFSNLPDGIVVGFTRDANFTAGGKAYVYSGDPGLGFNVVYDQSINSTIYALRHEISHNYGMGHDKDDSVCMMNYDHAYSVDYWDSSHETQLNDNRDHFGAL